MSSAPLTLNLVEGSVSISFSSEAAQELKAAINELMKSLKVVASKTPGTGKVSPRPFYPYQTVFTQG